MCGRGQPSVTPVEGLLRWLCARGHYDKAPADPLRTFPQFKRDRLPPTTFRYDARMAAARPKMAESHFRRIPQHALGHQSGSHSSFTIPLAYLILGPCLSVCVILRVDLSHESALRIATILYARGSSCYCACLLMESKVLTLGVPAGRDVPVKIVPPRSGSSDRK